MRRFTIPLLFILSLFLAVVTEGTAQRQTFTFQAVLPITTGAFGDAWGGGFGGMIAGSRDIGNRMHLTYSLAYLPLSPSDELGLPEDLTFTMVPIGSGIRYEFAKRKLIPYAILQGDVIIAVPPTESDLDADAHFGFSLGGGVRYEFKPGGAFAIGEAQYTHGIGDAEIYYITLSAGIGFTF